MGTRAMGRLVGIGVAEPGLATMSVASDASAAAFDREAMARTHVVAELEPSVECIRLHVTEDDVSYGVTASCGDVAAEAFDVQLDTHRVWIGRSAQAGAIGARVIRREDRRGVDRLFSLIFDQPIDAVNSHGESADGWLHLSLRKRGAQVPT